MNKREEKQARLLLARLEKERDRLRKLSDAYQVLSQRMLRENDGRTYRLRRLDDTISGLKDLLPEPNPETVAEIGRWAREYQAARPGVYEPGHEPSDEIVAR